MHTVEDVVGPVDALCGGDGVGGLAGLRCLLAQLRGHHGEAGVGRGVGVVGPDDRE